MSDLRSAEFLILRGSGQSLVKSFVYLPKKQSFQFKDIVFAVDCFGENDALLEYLVPGFSYSDKLKKHYVYLAPTRDSHGLFTVPIIKTPRGVRKVAITLKVWRDGCHSCDLKDAKLFVQQYLLDYSGRVLEAAKTISNEGASRDQ